MSFLKEIFYALGEVGIVKLTHQSVIKCVGPGEDD